MSENLCRKSYETVLKLNLELATFTKRKFEYDKVIKSLESFSFLFIYFHLF